MLGVAVTDAMTGRGLVSRREDHRAGDIWMLTPDGLDWLRDLGIDLAGTLDAARRTRRPVARGCLDWTERTPHLAGAAGAAVCAHFFAAGWIERVGNDRAVRLTETGEAALSDRLGLSLVEA